MLNTGNNRVGAIADFHLLPVLTLPGRIWGVGGAYEDRSVQGSEEKLCHRLKREQTTSDQVVLKTTRSSLQCGDSGNS